jgi:phosphopantetheinyl transferase (holo-ACP synthase)
LSLNKILDKQGKKVVKKTKEHREAKRYANDNTREANCLGARWPIHMAEFLA